MLYGCYDARGDLLVVPPRLRVLDLVPRRPPPPAEGEDEVEGEGEAVAPPDVLRVAGVLLRGPLRGGGGGGALPPPLRAALRDGEQVAAVAHPLELPLQGELPTRLVSVAPPGHG
eukprot:gene305-biopygen6846